MRNPVLLITMVLLFADRYAGAVGHTYVVPDSIRVAVGQPFSVSLHLVLSPDEPLPRVSMTPWDDLSMCQRLKAGPLTRNKQGAFLQMTLLALEPGTYQLPGLLVDGQPGPALPLHIYVPDLAPNARLAPIRDILPSAGGIHPGLVAALSILLLLLILLLHYRWKQRQPPALSPDIHLEAGIFEQLLALRESRLWMYSAHAFHDRLSLLLTSLIRQHIPELLALNTGAEWLQALARHGMPNEQLQSLRRILHTAEAVKFAKAETSEAENEALMAEAIRWAEAFLREKSDTDG
jgi:hypothetical protein